MTQRKPPGEHPPDEVAVITMTAGQYDAIAYDLAAGMGRYDVIGEPPWDKGLTGCLHWHKGGSIASVNGPLVAEARCRNIEEYLHRTTSKWCLLLDADMGGPEDLICRLLATAYAIDDEPKVVGALCFAGSAFPHWTMYPTIYRAARTDDGGYVTVRVGDYERDAVSRVAATGTAAMLIHRKILVHMAQDHPVGFGTFPDGRRNPQPWFTEGVSGAIKFGEDVAFCNRVNALGYGIYVDTSIKMDHAKRILLNEELYDLQQRLLAERAEAEPKIEAKPRKRKR